MKIIAMLFALGFVGNSAITVGSRISMARYETPNNPHTIVWKVEGQHLPHPAYLIGTCHAVSKSFLDSFPIVRQILQQADCLLTEIYPATETDTSSGVMDIKALPLLNKEQYALLDSFFKATAGPTEGLDNEEVKNISVRDFLGGITEMLLRKNGHATFDQMDRQLYESFKSVDKPTFALEKDSDLFFDKSDTSRARTIITRYINEGVKRPGAWDLSDPTSDLSKFVHAYKSFNLDYEFESPEPVRTNTIYSKKIADRNNKWIPKIEFHIQQQPTVIAVGFYHLAYRTGLINLLKAEGYKVTPVAI